MSDWIEGTQDEKIGSDDATLEGKEGSGPEMAHEGTDSERRADEIVDDKQSFTQVELQKDQEPSAETSADATPALQAAPQALGSIDSRFFAIRTTGGQERVVASLLQTRVNAKKLSIRSIIVLDSFKGYIIVEAPDSNVAYEALSGIRHVRGQIRGDLPFKDIEGYLVKKPVVSELSVDDTVEVIAGPFKAMKAKITRVDYEKQEATVVLLDSPYQIPVTVDANYLKKALH
ncbi:MAG: transcription elongation factor Spt5 [Nitrososphaera sp.]